MNNEIYKTYCLTCKEITRTINIKTIKERKRFKGNCEKCNEIKFGSDDPRYFEKPILLI